MARNNLKNIRRLLDQASNSMPIEQMFLADLKRSIEMTESKTKRQPSKTYKPSSMNCIRNMYFQVTGAKPKDDVTSYCSVGICNSGSDIHLRVQSAVNDMKNNNIDCEYINVADYVRSRNLNYLKIVKEPDFENGEYETKLYHKELNMSFMCDGIIRYKNHYYVLELKTEASFKWNKRDSVDLSHYKQGTAYSVAFDIPEVLFVYINRDILDMKAYMFVPTLDMKNELVGIITECDEYVAKKSIPPKPDNVTKKSCSYCSYSELCEKAGC